MYQYDTWYMSLYIDERLVCTPNGPQDRPDIHCEGGWVSPRAGLDGWGKSCPTQGFDTLTVQPPVRKADNLTTFMFRLS
jgi:hypothetical protein